MMVVVVMFVEDGYAKDCSKCVRISRRGVLGKNRWSLDQGGLNSQRPCLGVYCAGPRVQAVAVNG